MSFIGDAAASAGKKAAAKGAAKAAEKGAQKGAQAATEKAASTAAQKGAEKTTQKAAEKGTQTAGNKLGEASQSGAQKLSDAKNASETASKTNPLDGVGRDPKKALADPKAKVEKTPDQKLEDLKHNEKKKDATPGSKKDDVKRDVSGQAEKEKPEETKTLREKAKDAKKVSDERSREEEQTTKGKAKSIVKDVGGGAASGAAAGAATGAVAGGVGALPGAAIGAVKGAATGIVKNKTTRKGLIFLLFSPLIILAIVGTFMIGAMQSMLVSTVSVSEGGQDTAELAVASGIDQETFDAVYASSDSSNYPYTLTLAWNDLLSTGDDEEDQAVFPQSAFDVAMEEVDPTASYRNMIYRTEQNPLSEGGGLRIPETDEVKEAQEELRAVWVDAIFKAGNQEGEESLLDEKKAEQIYDKAVTLALGVGIDSCTAPSNTDPGSVDLEEAQKQHAITAMGVAKGMFPGDVEAQKQAATIALMTMAVEGGFKNYAHSGNPSQKARDNTPFSQADWDKLGTVSQSLPHDAIGQDHDSIGLMQQRASGSWGNSGDSNWQSDADGVIKRLMTPSFSIGKFIQVLTQKVPDWKTTSDRGGAAQTVQVSAFPDKYAERESEALSLISQHWASAPEVKPDAALGWDGAEQNPGETTQGAACGATLGEGTMGVGAPPIDEGNGTVSSVFGPRDCSDGISSCFHEGVDLSGVGGTAGNYCVKDIPVYSISSGIVEQAPDPGYGANNAIAIKYSEQLTFYYLHSPMDKFKIKVGDAVEAGQQITSMGSFGASTGCHLHIETHVEGEKVDPVPIIEQGFGVILPR